MLMGLKLVVAGRHHQPTISANCRSCMREFLVWQQQRAVRAYRSILGAHLRSLKSWKRYSGGLVRCGFAPCRVRKCLCIRLIIRTLSRTSPYPRHGRGQLQSPWMPPVSKLRLSSAPCDVREPLNRNAKLLEALQHWKIYKQRSNMQHVR
jgi:hypothetical protein